MFSSLMAEIVNDSLHNRHPLTRLSCRILPDNRKLSQPFDDIFHITMKGSAGNENFKRADRHGGGKPIQQIPFIFVRIKTHDIVILVQTPGTE